jgi:hypothetical protein
MDPERWKDTAYYIRELPIPPRRKKQLIVQWCALLGVDMTHDMVVEVLGEEARRV